MNKKHIVTCLYLDLFILLYKILLRQDDNVNIATITTKNKNEKSTSQFIRKEAYLKIEYFYVG